MKINKELLKGSTVMLILSLLERKEMYGYEMTKEIERRSGGTFALREGTLYPILHTLESGKLVEAYWDRQDGRKRKYYRITPAGKRLLEEKKAEWTLFRNSLDGVLGEGGA
ncbi:MULTISPECIES: PadR family transcriptional regulator [unclassified Paenibacillus]|uniref:PadR family transcriptional regulator n=1 Tax=unclassified Paenibacillus TaxID=185978 RepID=UPI001C1229DD|nr:MULTISPECIES: helix-turn-helix transcriptional regulator [unclassified Paenibacillus]MBU5443869.1 PadR family transcriptional regulator [Paenibacillus sp. MSJ-34]CAH0121508.1 Transcriptional regulator [Paenibacillus sp. CECT 9249]